MTHPHAAPEASPSDASFVRVFLLSVLLLAAAVAGFTALVDPLGAFGTGLIPPVVTNDRDQKVALYRSYPRRPELLVLGSSRSKTLDPACLEHLTGRPAFNFAVNGAGTEDFLAILRFVRAGRRGSVRQILLGLDPETLQGAGGVHRALEGSRYLGGYAPVGVSGRRRVSPAADLLGWQAFAAALGAVAHGRGSGEPPEFVLEPNGLQRYPRAEADLRTGRMRAAERVVASIPGALARYQSFPALDSERIGYLRQFVGEAHEAGIAVVTFIPPLHPAFARAAEQTAWRPRTDETVALLESLDRAGRARYVETRNLTIDTLQFVDAVHFLAPVANVVAGALLGVPDGCALQ
jgi:hypothetical protein